MSDRDQFLKNMDEFAAMTAMWIAFHEARPEVNLTWFIQHYKDGELFADVQGWPAGAPVEPVPAPTSESQTSGPTEPVLTVNGSQAFRWTGQAYVPILESESAPVPAPRLEWERIENCDRECSQTPHVLYGAQFKVHHNGTFVTMTFSGSLDLPTDDAAKSLAEKLNAVLSPPVGTQE